jgi:hypothetical protein
LNSDQPRENGSPPPPLCEEGGDNFSIRRLYRELEFFGRTKCDLLACFDLDRFAGCRVAPHSSWPLPDLEDAKTSNSYTFSLLEMLGNETDKIIEQRLSLPFRQLMLLGQTSREMLESDWTSGHFRLSCHNFEPFIESEEVELLRTDMIRGWMKSSASPKRIARVGS